LINKLDHTVGQGGQDVAREIGGVKLNFVRSGFLVWRISRSQVFFNLLLIILLSFYVGGCTEQVPTAEQLAGFERADPVCPAMDLDRLVEAGIDGGLYRVVFGDVLELTMPTILQVVMAKGLESVENVSLYLCRISDRGTITLPIVGEIEVAGKTLGQIESAIIDSYYPKYIGIRPSVLAQVAKYRTAKVSITGAVNAPGVYELQSDRMSLVALLMQAGGIIDDGAARIWIINANQAQPGHEENASPNISIDTSYFETEAAPDEASSEQPSETSGPDEDIEMVTEAESNKSPKPEPIVLPIKGLNIPYADVALHDGDTVIVERLEMPLFTVVGLVNKPGNFPYPPDARYNLMQAIAFAGGWDQAADPRYATIYRLTADGTIVRTPFQIIRAANGSRLTDASNIPIKPGDIVAIEHTPRTRRNIFLQRIFHFNVGAYVPIPIMR
jgi:protein involved in polysaccharide export with SLBB domain